jgi:hypothetical protein
VHFPLVYKDRHRTGRYNARRLFGGSWFHNISYSGNEGNLFGFFIKPRLSIRLGNIDENVEIRWGRLTETRQMITHGEEEGEEEVSLPGTFYTRRRFVNVIVKNEGRAVATNCEARLRLLTKTHGCQALSTEDKIQMWNDTLTNKTNISAKYGEKSFTLAFSQEEFTQDQIDSIGEIYCGVRNQNTTVHAWVGTLRALGTPENYNQDSLCQGEFKVHVDVITETGEKVSSHFAIKVGDNWKSLTAEMDACNCTIG